MITQDRRAFGAQAAAGYAGCASLPLEVRAHRGELHIQPADEILSLRKEILLSMEDASADSFNDAVNRIKERQLEILLELPNGDFTLYAGKKTLSYRRDRDFGFRDDEYRGNAAAAHLSGSGNTLTLRVIADRSLIECFLNGQVYCASRNYMREGEFTQFRLASDGGIRKAAVYSLPA